MLLLLAWALAAEVPPEEGLEIIVEDVPTTVDARARLDQAIVERGYRPGVRAGDQTVYLPRGRGWPVVVVLAELDALRGLPPEELQVLVHAIWWNTADTPEGLQVRLWVEDWAAVNIGPEFVEGLGVRYEYQGPPPDWSFLWEPEQQPPDPVQERPRPQPSSGLSHDILSLELP